MATATMIRKTNRANKLYNQFALRALPTVQEVEDELSFRYLKHFVRQMWPVIETDTFMGNWHIDAICDHLQGVVEGKIRRLLINIPPRTSKSLTVSVFFPAWAWLHHPEKKWLFSSYAYMLSMRDSLRCRRLIESDEYSRLLHKYSPNFALTSTGGGKERYANTFGGYRLATSVGGSLTGEGGDIICFPRDEVVWTERGPVPIGDVVDSRMAVKVWSTNTQTGQTSMKPITGWHKNPASRIVEVGLDDGTSFRCTPDHNIWTMRGWVKAQDLLSNDMLPRCALKDMIYSGAIDPELASQCPLRKSGRPDFPDSIIGQLGVAMRQTKGAVRRLSKALRDRNPRSPVPDLLNGHRPHAVSFGENIGAFVALCYFNGLGLGQLGPRPLLIHGEGSMPLGIGNVHGPCAVTEIFKSVVSRITVHVSNLPPGRTRADKGQQDNLVDKHADRFSVLPRIEMGIALAIRWFKNATRNRCRSAATKEGSRNTLDPTQVGNEVPIEAGYRKPIFIRDAGHVDSTFCLTVADNHTFLVGGGQVIVSNCVDDPHNVIETESNTMRENVLMWWDESMSTRLNNPDTGAYIVIMQRVHEADLSGHILSKSTDAWDHLCIPAEFEGDRIISSLNFCDPRKVQGESMWPERLTPSVLAQYKAEMTEYAYAGQFQQRPAPRAGGLFKVEKFLKTPHINPAEITASVRYWDKAGTHGGGAATAGVRMVKLSSGMYAVIDVVRGHWEAGEREEIIRKTAEQDGHETVIFIEQEPGSGGKESAQYTVRNLAGYRIRPDRPSGDKATRAEPFADQVYAGNVMLLERGWTKAYIDELRSFPRGRYKDQADASSGAFIKLASMSRGVVMMA